MKTKRLVSIVVTVVFSLVMVCAAYASSVSFSDIDGNKHKDAIEQMAELGILNGYPDGTYRPEGDLNRAAAAKVAAYILGYTEEDAQEAAGWEPMFTDVYGGMGDHEWALGWINLVANDGVINGFPGGDYRPGGELQMVQWIAILVRILDHEEEEMSWPDDYNRMADSLGLSANLSYSGGSVVNRAQMARMTNTAIYDVEMPNGKRIIEVVDFGITEEDDEPVEEENGEDEQHEEVYENVAMSVSAVETLLPAGGGRTTQITAYVTHDNMPAEGAPVGFFAFIESNSTDRSGQLSAVEAVTDADGKATVTYTSLAADDNKYIKIKANTRDDEDPDGWLDSNNITIIASGNASLVKGRVINPFTGEAYPNADIDFFIRESEDYSMFENATDENGCYSIAVQPGKYNIGFNLDFGNETHYSGNYTGSHHEFRGDNTVVLRINEMQIDKNKTYTFDTEMGVIKGVAKNLGSDSNIYITPSGSATGTVIANTNEDGSFMIPVPEGNYDVGDSGGHIFKAGVNVEKGKEIDLGTFSR